MFQTTVELTAVVGVPATQSLLFYSYSLLILLFSSLPFSSIEPYPAMRVIVKLGLRAGGGGGITLLQKNGLIHTTLFHFQQHVPLRSGSNKEPCSSSSCSSVDAPPLRLKTGVVTSLAGLKMPAKSVDTVREGWFSRARCAHPKVFHLRVS